MENAQMLQTKVCPQCGQLLFADMDVCFGCLHSFEREGAPAVGQAFITARQPSTSARHLRDVDQVDMAMDEPPDMEDGAIQAQSFEEDEDTLLGEDWLASSMDSDSDTEEVPAESLNTHDAEDKQEVRPADLTMMLPRLPTSASKVSNFALRIQTAAVDVVVPLPALGLNIGRASDNDVILHSRAVSRRHVHIDPTKQGAMMLDLGATNPVLFQGREAPSELALMTGDTIDICGAVVSLIERPE